MTVARDGSPAVSPLASVLPHRRTPPMPGTRGSRIAALPGLGPRGTGSRDDDDDSPSRDRDLPDFLDAVDAVLDTRETGESPRIKISACPTYLVIEYQLIQTRTRCDVGAGLTACIVNGLEQLSHDPAIRDYDSTLSLIRESGNAVLPLRARTALHKTIGTTHRPGIIFRLSIPCGEVETLHFRLPRPHQSRIYTRAGELGMHVSSLAGIALGLGLVEFSDNIDPESVATVREDRDALCAKVRAQNQAVRELFELYVKTGQGDRT